MTSYSTSTRQRLAFLATACLMSVALPAGPAWAQKTKTKPAQDAQATEISIESEIDVDIPTIEAVDSNVDEATLRDIFSGNLINNADALAGLTATSITIPEIVLSSSTTVEGATHDTTVTFSDLILSDIVDGTAETVTLGSMSLDAGEEGSGEFGALSSSSFNIAGVLGMYGLVDRGGQTELETIYTDFSFEGGSFEAPDASCTIGSMTAAEFKARPLSYSFAEIMATVEALEAQEDDPSPELVGSAMRMYAELFTAFESSPVEFSGFDCGGLDEEGNEFSFTIDAMSMGGMSPGIYPALSVDGLVVAVEDDGVVEVGNFTFKEMDLSGPLAAIEAAPDAIDEEWFAQNARALFPAFAGLAFSDVVVDIPDPENDGARLQGSIGAFDLTLDAYLNGIPTDVLTTASNIYLELPEDSEDEQLQQLLALGVTSIDAGFTIDAAWNEAENTISIDELSVTGVDLATIALAGTITNATEALFGMDEDQALMAAMGVAISNLTLDITDDGLTDIILASVAAEQGADPATLRPVFAGLAEGTIVGMLAGAAEAQKVGAALNSFVSGRAKYLTIDMTAKEAPGLGLADFVAAESDPTALLGKVTIDASAK